MVGVCEQDSARDYAILFGYLVVIPAGNNIKSGIENSCQLKVHGGRIEYAAPDSCSCLAGHSIVKILFVFSDVSLFYWCDTVPGKVKIYH